MVRAVWAAAGAEGGLDQAPRLDGAGGAVASFARLGILNRGTWVAACVKALHCNGCGGTDGFCGRQSWSASTFPGSQRFSHGLNHTALDAETQVGDGRDLIEHRWVANLCIIPTKLGSVHCEQ